MEGVDRSSTGTIWLRQFERANEEDSWGQVDEAQTNYRRCAPRRFPRRDGHLRLPVAPLCSAGALTAALRASRLCEQIVADRQQWPASSISRADAVSAGLPAAGVLSEL